MNAWPSLSEIIRSLYDEKPIPPVQFLVSECTREALIFELRMDRHIPYQPNTADKAISYRGVPIVVDEGIGFRGNAAMHALDDAEKPA